MKISSWEEWDKSATSAMGVRCKWLHLGSCFTWTGLIRPRTQCMNFMDVISTGVHDVLNANEM